MNLLEHYIIKILSEDYKDNFVRVSAVVNCYGGVSKYTGLFTISAWETAKQNGYFLAEH